MPPVRAAGRSWSGSILLALAVLALVGLLLWSATHGDLPQFQGKAMDIRLVCAPIAATLVPAAWWLARHSAQRPLDFPATSAALVVVSLVIDLAGNATRLYDTVEYFDDAVHAVNPLLLVSALALLLCHTGLPRWATWVMAFGLGCAGNIVWEIAEYGLMERLGADGLGLSLADTLSDQAWGLLGAAVGATLPMLWSSAAPEQPSAHDLRHVPELAAATAHQPWASTA